MERPGLRSLDNEARPSGAAARETGPATDALIDPPRHLFFGVEDRRLGGRAGLEDKYLSMERARRQKLAQHVIDSALQVANAVRTMRTFDRTGNADQVLDHLGASLDDLCKQTRHLIAEVENSVDRYSDGIDALATRDAAKAAAALNAPAAGEPSPQGSPVAGPQPAAVPVSPQPGAAAGPTTVQVTPRTLAMSIDAALAHAQQQKLARR